MRRYRTSGGKHPRVVEIADSFNRPEHHPGRPRGKVDDRPPGQPTKPRRLRRRHSRRNLPRQNLDGHLRPEPRPRAIPFWRRAGTDADQVDADVETLDT